MSPPQQHQKRTMLKQYFTLIELLVAMAVFVIMMSMLMTFFASAQNAWQQASQQTRVYENARVALDMISRDVATAIASDTEGAEIPFCYFSSTSDIFFVAPQPETDTDSQLCEVAYSVSSNKIMRHLTKDTSSNWDFYGSTTPWAYTSSTSYPLIGGVESLSFTCTSSMPAGCSHTLPNRVTVTLTLFDENLMDMPEAVQNARKKESMRTFMRVIRLNN